MIKCHIALYGYFYFLSCYFASAWLDQFLSCVTVIKIIMTCENTENYKHDYQGIGQSIWGIDGKMEGMGRSRESWSQPTDCGILSVHHLRTIATWRGPQHHWSIEVVGTQLLRGPRSAQTWRSSSGKKKSTTARTTLTTRWIRGSGRL